MEKKDVAQHGLIVVTFSFLCCFCVLGASKLDILSPISPVSVGRAEHLLPEICVVDAS